MWLCILIPDLCRIFPSDKLFYWDKQLLHSKIQQQSYSALPLNTIWTHLYFPFPDYLYILHLLTVF